MPLYLLELRHAAANKRQFPCSSKTLQGKLTAAGTELIGFSGAISLQNHDLELQNARRRLISAGREKVSEAGVVAGKVNEFRMIQTIVVRGGVRKTCWHSES